MSSYMNIMTHNMLSMNANRQYGITTDKKAKSTEKLSSGYKINRSADDAAGLAISEKMRRQIRGLTQASANCQDGVSLCQVADGALNETQYILQRINELAVKSANGTNTETDRGYIQKEVDQLVTEVDRIANETSFNDDIYPLKGNGVDVALKSFFFDHSINLKTINDTSADVKVEGKICHPGEEVETSGVLFYGDYLVSCISRFNSNGHVNGECANWFSSTPMRLSSLTNIDGYSSDQTTAHISYTKSDEYHIDENGYVYFTWDEYLKDTPDLEVERFYVIKDNTKMWRELNGTPSKEDSESMGYLNIGDLGCSDKDLKGIWLQMGAEASQGMYLKMVDASTSSLGIEDADVSTQEKAEQTIERIKSAIVKVSDFRSNFGAQQNRLEHTIKNLDNVIENTTNAESQIRDTDMAKEMVDYSNNSILAQVGESMLAQANQSNQGILSLLG